MTRAGDGVATGEVEEANETAARTGATAAGGTGRGAQGTRGKAAATERTRAKSTGSGVVGRGVAGKATAGKTTAGKARAGKAMAGKGARKGPSLAVRKAVFIERLRESANVSRSAREAGLSSSTVYGHRTRNAGFARDWDAALAEALDEVESELIERARRGVEKPVYFRGEVVGSVRSYSDTLAMFILKAKRPEVYDRLGGANRDPAGMSQEEAKAEVMSRLSRLAEDEDAA